jgi:hypothetical protein
MSIPTRLKSINELHRFNNISAPNHPLISLIDYSEIKPTPVNNELKWGARILYYFYKNEMLLVNIVMVKNRMILMKG